MNSTSEPLTHPPAPAHSPECRKWFLAFTAAKQFLMSAQRTCPACLAKHPPKQAEPEKLRCDDCGATFDNTEQGKGALFSHACQ
jgi:DNA gyrase inhibitor GyrI